MPTVFKLRGFTFKFYSNENNEPPHVHVIQGTAESKWWIDPSLEEEYGDGFKVQELRTIRELLKCVPPSLERPLRRSLKASDPPTRSTG
ncbi:MAG: DUF4160 domain-containing protein [Flavobacteriales bacterium]|nr:DUF4160 domain-containing protein [Flavobacteriales bacterium]